jgi:hypothetical protein
VRSDGGVRRRPVAAIAVMASVLWSASPSLHYVMAARHLADRDPEYGWATSALLLVSPLWVAFFLPGVLSLALSLLAVRSVKAGRGLLGGGVLMVVWAAAILENFRRQGDVHLALWVPWSLAAVAGCIVCGASRRLGWPGESGGPA